MRIAFMMSGSLVAEIDLPFCPPVGSNVVFKMEHYKKGLTPGTIVEFTVQGDLEPPTFDLTDPDRPEVTLDVHQWRVVSKGPPMD